MHICSNVNDKTFEGESFVIYCHNYCKENVRSKNKSILHIFKLVHRGKCGLLKIRKNCTCDSLKSYIVSGIIEMGNSGYGI